MSSVSQFEPDSENYLEASELNIMPSLGKSWGGGAAPPTPPTPESVEAKRQHGRHTSVSSLLSRLTTPTASSRSKQRVIRGASPTSTSHGREQHSNGRATASPNLAPTSSFLERLSIGVSPQMKPTVTSQNTPTRDSNSRSRVTTKLREELHTSANKIGNSRGLRIYETRELSRPSALSSEKSSTLSGDSPSDFPRRERRLFLKDDSISPRTTTAVGDPGDIPKSERQGDTSDPALVNALKERITQLKVTHNNDLQRIRSLEQMVKNSNNTPDANEELDLALKARDTLQKQVQAFMASYKALERKIDDLQRDLYRREREHAALIVELVDVRIQVEEKTLENDDLRRRMRREQLSVEKAMVSRAASYGHDPGFNLNFGAKSHLPAISMTVGAGGASREHSQNSRQLIN